MKIKLKINKTSSRFIKTKIKDKLHSRKIHHHLKE